jgi:UDP-glucuronate decarboxylase
MLRYWQAEAAGRGPEFSVSILTRSKDRFLADNPMFVIPRFVEFIEGDVLRPETLPDNQSFTHILHAATDSTIGPLMEPLARYEQIVNGTRHLLDFAAKTGVRRFLLASSGGIYGAMPSDMERFTEAFTGAPDLLSVGNAYSTGKRASEHLCMLYQHKFGIESVIARCFAFVGVDLPRTVHFAIGNFINDALDSPSIIVNGSGLPLRSYMDQRDLAKWLMTLLAEAPGGQAYNVGSDQAVSIRDLACMVRDSISPGKPVDIRGNPAADNSRNIYVPDITKARSIGLRLNYSLRDSIDYVRDMLAGADSQDRTS